MIASTRNIAWGRTFETKAAVNKATTTSLWGLSSEDSRADIDCPPPSGRGRPTLVATYIEWEADEQLLDVSCQVDSL
jgi:hypothetical protein